MSAVGTTGTAQGCVHAALAADVATIGGVAVAAVEAGVSEDTIRRWCARTNGAWTDDAIVAVIRQAKRVSGRSAALDALQAAADGVVVIAAAAEDADAQALRLLVELAQSTSVDGAAMADGHLDLAEGREFLAHLQRLQAALPRAIMAIQDKLRRGVA